MAQSLTERAESARKQLFERYDQLNALWTEAEEQLASFHVPREVQCDYHSSDAGDRDSPAGYDRYCCLGLYKHNGKWRIGHGYADDLSPDVEHWTPITECSAEIRVMAAEHLPKLREAVVRSAESFVVHCNTAIKHLQAALKSDIAELLAERAKLNGKAK